MQCLGNGIDFISAAAPDGVSGAPIRVEIHCLENWFSAGQWLSVPERDIGFAAADSCVTVHGLAPNRDFHLRLWWPGLEEPQLCKRRTCGAPPVAPPPWTTRRTPNSLLVEWTVTTPAGGHALECQLEMAQDSLLSGWTPVAGQAVSSERKPYLSEHTPEDGTNSSATGLTVELWSAIVEGLLPSTEYLFRVRAMNAAGWSEAFSPPGRGLTSGPPLPPRNLQVVARMPKGLTISFEYEDADGASTSDVVLEVFHLLNWVHVEPQELELDLRDCRQNKRRKSSVLSLLGPTRSGRVTFSTKPDTEICVRIWTKNQVGCSVSPSKFLTCRPSSRPGAITKFRCTGRWPTAIEIEWLTYDPGGAPVTNCRIECSRDGIFKIWNHASASMAFCVCENWLDRIGVSIWRARIEELQPCSNYWVRGVARNVVGWSEEQPEHFSFRTADVPQEPRWMRSCYHGVNEVWLDFEVPCDAVQARCLPPVSEAAVEQAGVMVWTRIPPNLVRFEEVPVGGFLADSDERNEFCDFGVRASKVVFFRGRVVILGLEADTYFSFGVILGNGAGWKRVGQLTCHTALRPATIEIVRAKAVSLFTVQLEWALPDPVDAPVLDCDVQVREDSVFSAWRMCNCAELQRRKPKSEDVLPMIASLKSETHSVDCLWWERQIDGLEPGRSYVFRVRAQNAAGIEQRWSPEIRVNMPVPPVVKNAKAILCKSRHPAMEFQPFEQGDAANSAVDVVTVNITISEPVGAPVRMCLVTAMNDGSNSTVHPATRLRDGFWKATIPLSEEDGPLTNLKIRALNSVLWSEEFLCPVSKDENPRFQHAKDYGSFRETFVDEEAHDVPSLVRDFARELIQEQIKKCDEVSLQLEDLFQEFRGTGDERESALAARMSINAHFKIVLLSLEESEIDCVDGQRYADWLTQCGSCLEAWSAAWSSRHESAPSQRRDQIAVVAAEGLKMVMEGAVWLEKLMQDILLPLWDTLCERLNKAPRAFRRFAREQGVWNQQFVEQLQQAWSATASACLHLTALVAERAPLEDPAAVARPEGPMRERLPKVLSSLRLIREAGEQQAKKLRRVTDMMIQVTDVDGISRAFAEVSTVDKVQESGLSLVLSLLMPLPGSFELGALSIGTLWLDGDAAGKHSIVQHRRRGASASVCAAAVANQFRLQPREEGNLILREWASARGLPGAVVVHNASAKAITVCSSSPTAQSAMTRTYRKVQQAHPYARWVARNIEGLIGGTGIFLAGRALTVPPACVSILPFPPDSEKDVEVEFAYGVGENAGRPIGRVNVVAGEAVSFVSFDNGVRVNNCADARHGGRFPTLNAKLEPSLTLPPCRKSTRKSSKGGGNRVYMESLYCRAFLRASRRAPPPNISLTSPPIISVSSRSCPGDEGREVPLGTGRDHQSNVNGELSRGELVHNAVQLAALYKDDRSLPKWSLHMLKMSTLDRFMDTAKLYCRRHDDLQMVERIATEREPANVKMERLYDEDALRRAFGWMRGAYELSAVGNLMSNIAVYCLTPILAGEEMHETHVINVVGYAFDEPTQPDFEHFFPAGIDETFIGSSEYKQLVDGLRTMWLYVFECAKSLGLPAVAMAKKRADLSDAIWSYVIMFCIGLEVQEHPGLAAMIVKDSFDPVRRLFPDIMVCGIENVEAPIGEGLEPRSSLADTLLVNVCDPWSLLGSGDPNTEVAGTLLGHVTAMPLLLWPLTNPRVLVDPVRIQPPWGGGPAIRRWASKTSFALAPPSPSNTRGRDNERLPASSRNSLETESVGLAPVPETTQDQIGTGATDGSHDDGALAGPGDSQHREGSEEKSVASGTLDILVENRDVDEVTVRIYLHTGATIRLFDKPLITAVLGPGEGKQVNVPVPTMIDPSKALSYVGCQITELRAAAAVASACPEIEDVSADMDHVETMPAENLIVDTSTVGQKSSIPLLLEGPLLDVEFASANGRTTQCNAVDGQILSYEGFLL